MTSFRTRGDRIALVAQPIARGIDTAFSRVFGVEVNLANCGGCKKMRENLNNGMSFTQALRQRIIPQTSTIENTMTRLNCTITVSDDNHLIFETRGGKPTLKTIPMDDKAPQALYSAVESAIQANKRPERPAAPSAPAAPATPEPTKE